MKHAFVTFCQRWLTPVAALVVGLIGVIGLAGWILEIEELKSFVASGVTIKANTALCLSLAAIAILALRYGHDSGFWQPLGRACAAVIAAIGLATLFEHATQRDLGIDQLIATEAPGAIATSSPGRMGPPASLAFFLTGLSLFALPVARGKWTQLGGFVVCIIASVPLIGYAYHIPPLYGISRYTGIAAHTAFALLVLGVATISLRREHGFIAALCADDAGGDMARRMILPALFLPFVFGWLRTVGERAGWIDPAVGRPLLVVSLTIAMALLTYWNARAMSSFEARKRADDQAALDALEAAKATAEQAREKAEGASRVKSEFIATLSHEMRTPLSAVLLRVSAFEDHPDFPAALREDLEEMRQNLLLEINLISDLLDLTRIERGSLSLEKTDLDLHHLIAATIAMCRRSETAPIEFRPTATRCCLSGDKTRLHQVFWNLLTNAQKFTPSSGRIFVETANGPDGSILVQVRDNGRGFSSEIGQRMFTAFEQGETRDERQRSGLGLGLSITRTLVEAHRGTIAAHSSGPGEGSTFTIELPTLETNLPEPPAVSPKEHIAVPALHILLVEDHGPTLTITKRLLTRLGHHVTTATNAEDALQATKENAFDVLLTDLGLPDASGIDLMRALGDRFRQRAIAISGYGTEEDRRTTRDAGFAAHLVKPVEMSAITEALSAVMALPKASSSRSPMPTE